MIPTLARRTEYLYGDLAAVLACRFGIGLGISCYRGLYAPTTEAPCKSGIVVVLYAPFYTIPEISRIIPEINMHSPSQCMSKTYNETRIRKSADPK